MRDTAAVVLAAGEGKRMGATVPKPLVPVAGKPMVRHVLQSLEDAGVKRIAVVIGHDARAMRVVLGDRYPLPYQAVRSGTADAVACAQGFATCSRNVFVLVGDSPLLKSSSLRRLHEHHLSRNAACSFLTATFTRPYPYARVLRRDDGSVRRVVEERDATDAELRVTELLTSHFIFNTEALFEVLADVPRHPQTGERYLTDALSLMAARGGRIEALSLPDWRELVGLNTPQDLAWAERVLRAEPTFAGG